MLKTFKEQLFLVQLSTSSASRNLTKSHNKISKGDKNLRATDTSVKHNHHQLWSNHLIHAESEGQPSGTKN